MRIRMILIIVIVALMILSTWEDSQAGNIHPALFGPSRFVVAGDSVDVWVFFTDRGYKDDATMRQALQDAQKSLLPRTQARRAKMNRPSLVDVHDLPMNVHYAQAVIDLGARYRTASRYFNALSVRAPRSILEQVAALSFVREIRPVAKAWRPLPQSDWNLSEPMLEPPPGVDILDYGPSYAQLNQINVVAAHDSGYSGAGVLVCLLDTGFFTDHEALINQPVVAEWDFINNDPETANQPGDPPGQHNHGTFTFSALGGAHDGQLYGPAYGASFVLGKTENIASETPIEEDYYVAGLEWADSLGAEVVSTSLGYFDWYTFADLDGNTCVTTIGVDIAVANGIVCVTAAGNERQSSWGHIIAPADADSVITVGAVDSTGMIAIFSSPGPTYDGRIKPEVCARGVATYCASPTGSQPTTNYAYIGGTSLSTPLVGGSCALILEAHPDWTPMQVRQALLSTASNALTPNNDYGWGVINVLAAINFNMPPVILQRHPEAGTFIAYEDTLQTFWVSVADPDGDSLTYHWWVDTTEVYSGPDSQFAYSWSDPDTAIVKVVVQDRCGFDSTSWTVQIEPYLTVEKSPQSAPPAAFVLHRNFPNPFNAATTISFDLPQISHARLTICDVSGRLITTLLDANLPAGHHQQVFNASSLPSGIYFCRLLAGEFSAAIKIVYAK